MNEFCDFIKTKKGNSKEKAHPNKRNSKYTKKVSSTLRNNTFNWLSLFILLQTIIASHRGAGDVLFGRNYTINRRAEELTIIVDGIAL